MICWRMAKNGCFEVLGYLSVDSHLKRLEESGGGRETRRRHTDYVLTYIDQAQPNFIGPDSAI